jgi:hypothetical protein
MKVFKSLYNTDEIAVSQQKYDNAEITGESNFGNRWELGCACSLLNYQIYRRRHQKIFFTVAADFYGFLKIILYF